MMANKEFNEFPEYVVKKAKSMGADDVVCSAVKGTTRQVRFANSSVTASKLYENISVDIFLTWKKRVVNSEVYDLTAIDGAIEQLFRLAKVSSGNNDYQGIAEGKFKYRNERPDPKIAGLSHEKLMDYVEEGINSALKAGAKRVAGTLYTTVSEECMATSKGIALGQSGAAIEISMRAFADKDASGHGVSCATKLTDFSPSEAGEKSGRIAKEALSPKEGKPGKFTVLWEPISIANFIDHVGGSASAFNVDAGWSFLKDKIGKRVASDLVTICDDGTTDGGLDSSVYDDEGVPTQKTTIIDKGILKTYLHNTSTARKYKTETTANAGLIGPRTWNIIFGAGDHSREELIEEVRDGLYITNLWYTRFQNYTTGDFSTIPRDGIFVIKNGKIAGSVKGIRVSDNMQRILESITAVGKQRWQIHWWEVNTPVFMPYVIAKDVNITKSTQ